MTLRGFATADAGVLYVRVNGVEASLFPLVMDSAASSQKEGGVKKDTFPSPKDTRVEWKVKLNNLQKGETQVVVEVVDQAGQMNAYADTIKVNFLGKIPTSFSLDTINQRVIGVVNREVVSYDLFTKAQQVHAHIGQVTPNSACFDPATDNFYYVAITYDGTGSDSGYSFRRVNLSSGAGPDVVFSAERDDEAPQFTESLFCDLENDSLYLLVRNAVSSQGINRSVIHKIALSPKPSWSVLHKTDMEASNPYVVTNMAISSDVIIAQSNIEFEENARKHPFGQRKANVMAISKDDGSREVLYEGYDKYVLDIVKGSMPDDILLVHFSGVDRLDTSDNTYSELGYVGKGHPLEFSQPRSAGLDASNARVIIGDSALDSLVAIDLNSKERSLLLTSGVGEGPKLIAPRAVVTNSTLTKAYIFDDGGNAASKVVEVDLGSGDRKVIGAVSNVSVHDFSGMGFDEGSGVLYVGSVDSIYKLDVNLDTTDNLSLREEGVGAVIENMAAIALDVANNRILAYDSLQKGVFAIDLETLNRTLISKLDQKGSGDDFGGNMIRSMVLDAETEKLYLGSQLEGIIQSVDLRTGDREILPASCEQFGESETLMNLSFDPQGNNILVWDNHLRMIDLSDNECHIVDRWPGHIGGASISEQRLLSLTFGTLNLFDLQSGEQVILSK